MSETADKNQLEILTDEEPEYEDDEETPQDDISECPSDHQEIAEEYLPPDKCPSSDYGVNATVRLVWIPRYEKIKAPNAEMRKESRDAVNENNHDFWEQVWLLPKNDCSQMERIIFKEIKKYRTKFEGLEETLFDQANSDHLRSRSQFFTGYCIRNEEEFVEYFPLTTFSGLMAFENDITTAEIAKFLIYSLLRFDFVSDLLKLPGSNVVGVGVFGTEYFLCATVSVSTI